MNIEEHLYISDWPSFEAAAAAAIARFEELRLESGEPVTYDRWTDADPGIRAAGKYGTPSYLQVFRSVDGKRPPALRDAFIIRGGEGIVRIRP
jgi:hypothetical protein